MGEQNVQETARTMIQQAANNPEVAQQLQYIMALAQAVAVEMETMKQQPKQKNQQPQQKVKAALGTKLDYLNKLKGVCPEGTEKVYLKNGGCMCKQKAAEGTELKKKEQSKNEVQKFKAQKGANSKKFIEPTDTVNTKFGPRDLNGKTKFPKWDPKKENYDFSTRMRVQEKDEKSGKKVIGSACGSKMKKKK